MRPSDAPVSSFVEVARQIMFFQAQQLPAALGLSDYQVAHNLQNINSSDSSKVTVVSSAYEEVKKARCRQALVSLIERLLQKVGGVHDNSIFAQIALEIIIDAIDKDFDLEKIKFESTLLESQLLAATSETKLSVQAEIKCFVGEMKKDFPIDKAWGNFKTVISLEANQLLSAVKNDFGKEPFDDSATRRKIEELKSKIQPESRVSNEKCQQAILAITTTTSLEEKVAESEIQRKAEDLKIAVNSQDSRGNTPLHYALENGNVILAALYLKMGARMDILNNEGKTPLKMSKANLLLTLTDSYEIFSKYARDELSRGEDTAFTGFLSKITYTGNNPLQWAVVHQQLGSFRVFQSYAQSQIDDIWHHENNQGEKVFNTVSRDGRSVVDLVTAGEALGSEKDRVSLVDEVFKQISGYCKVSSSDQGASVNALAAEFDPKKLEETVLHKDKTGNFPLTNAAIAARRAHEELIRTQQRADLVDQFFADTIRHLRGILKAYGGEKTKRDYHAALTKLVKIEESMLSLVTGEEESLWVSRAETLRQNLADAANIHRGITQIAPGFFRSRTSNYLDKIKFDNTTIPINIQSSHLRYPSDSRILEDSLLTEMHTAINSGSMDNIQANCRAMTENAESMKPSLLGITSQVGSQAQNPSRWAASLIEKCDVRKKQFSRRLEAYKAAFSALEGYLSFAMEDVFFGRELIEKRLKLVRLVRKRILDGRYENIEAAVTILKNATNEEGAAEASCIPLMQQKRIPIAFWQSPYSQLLLDEIPDEAKQIALTA